MPVFLPKPDKHLLVGMASVQCAWVDGFGIINLRAQQEIQSQAYGNCKCNNDEDDDSAFLIHGAQLIFTISYFA